MISFAALGLGWAVMLAAAGLAIVFATKRRCCRPVRAAAPAMRPTIDRTNGGGATRRSIGGFVIAVIAVVALMKMVHYQRSREHGFSALAQARVAADQARARNDGPPGTITVTPPTPPPAYRKAKNWLKPDLPPANDLAPHWRATIKHVRVLALPNSENEVLNQVCTKLKDELRLRITPPLSFAANQEWVRVPEKMEEAVVHDPDPQIGDYIPVTYQFELTREGWRELGRLDRADLAETRMIWAARGLGLFTVLLGAIAAYIRLDEWTKGYFSGRLFLAAGLLVAGLGFAIMTV